MQKNLIIKETKTSIIMSVEITTSNGKSKNEIARFSNSGMGWVALGAAGRQITKHAMLDTLTFVGKPSTYAQLVALGVIEA